MSSAFGRFGSSSTKRPSNDSARGPGAPGENGHSANSSTTLTAGMTRAERFEDERKRITESCFSKIDNNGQLHESYITHIRITEDAAFPQTPPPPNSNPAGKKARVVIISVRNSGRVRLHKGRENANGTFSIGKTWNMEDLSAIENWVHLVPKNKEQAQRKQWAGETGFTVTIAKAYYWEAGTAKEKEFFIASMIKIFHKYTQGKLPILTGFDAAQLESLTNPQPSPQPAQAGMVPPGPMSSQPSTLMPPPSPGFSRGPPQQAQQNMYTMPAELDSGPPPPRDERRPPQLGNERRPSAGDDRRAPAGDDRRPIVGEDRRPTPLGDERRPRPSGEQRRPPPLGGERRPPPLQGDRRPPQALGDERWPPGSRPTTGDSERAPPRRPPTAEGDRRPPPFRGPPGHSRPPTGDDERRHPALRGPPSQSHLQSQMVPPMQPHDGERRPRQRPSQEQNLRSRPSRERMEMRSHPSRDQMRSPMPGPMPGSMPVELPTNTPSLTPQGLTPQSSRSQMSSQRPKTPESGSSLPANPSPVRRPRQADDAPSQTAVDEPVMSGVGLKPRDPRRPSAKSSRDESPRDLRPSTSQSNASSAFSRNDDATLEDRPQRTAPPERKRPPIPFPQPQQSQRSIGSESNNEFHTPLPSPPPPSSLPNSLQAGRKAPEGPREAPKPFTPRETQSSAPQTESEVHREPVSPMNDLPLAYKRTEKLIEPEPQAEPEPEPEHPQPSQQLSQPSQPPVSPLPEIPEPLAPIQAPAETEVAKVETPSAPAGLEPPESRPLLLQTKSAVVQPTETEKETGEANPDGDTLTKTQSAPVEPPTASSESEDENQSRPGLGPMVKLKKPKEVANTLRKAAFAYGAFKPRAGGAADKLLQKEKEAKESDESDGIRGVFQAPSRRVVAEPEKKVEPEKPAEPEKKEETEEVPEPTKTEPEAKVEPGVTLTDGPPADTGIPSLTVSSPLSSAPTALVPEQQEQPLSQVPDQLNVKTEPDGRKKKRRSNQQVQNIAKLGIDPRVLDGRGIDFESLLSDFGWGSSELSPKNLDNLELDIKREISRVEG